MLSKQGLNAVPDTLVIIDATALTAIVGGQVPPDVECAYLRKALNEQLHLARTRNDPARRQLARELAYEYDDRLTSKDCE